VFLRGHRRYVHVGKLLEPIKNLTWFSKLRKDFENSQSLLDLDFSENIHRNVTCAQIASEFSEKEVHSAQGMACLEGFYQCTSSIAH
jgi:hypothetical protein